MADNYAITAGSGTTMAADELTDGTLGSVKVAYGKIMDGAINGTNKLSISAGGAALVDGSATTQPVSGTVTANIGTIATLATAAKQDTIIGHVDGIEGVLGTIDADTGNISTKIDTIAGAVSGSEMQVDVLTMPSTAVTNAGLTELAAAINSNILDVNIAASAISVGGTAAADDADFTAGTTPGTPAMGVFESTPTSVTDGDLGTVGITAGRRLKTSATVDAALPAGTNAIGKLAANSGVDIGDVDVTSSALPTGASTLAEQQTQTTALQLIDDIVYTDDTSTHATGTSKGALFMAAATPTDTAVSANDIGAVAMTNDRKLHVSVQDSLPAGSAAIGKLAANSGVDIGDVDVTSSALPTGAATSANQSTEITALQLIDDTIFTDDAAFTPATSKVSVAGFEADEASTDSVDEGDAGAARMTLNRQQIVTVRPNASGEGLDIFRSLDLDETEEDVKTSAGKVYGWFMYNNASATTYVKFYNDTAANVVVGTTTPVLTVPIPGGSAANVEFANGIPFSAAICVAATTGVADANTGAPAANDLVANIFYK